MRWRISSRWVAAANDCPHLQLMCPSPEASEGRVRGFGARLLAMGILQVGTAIGIVRGSGGVLLKR